MVAQVSQFFCSTQASLLFQMFKAVEISLLRTLLLQSCGPPMINLSVMAGASWNALFVKSSSTKLLIFRNVTVGSKL